MAFPFSFAGFNTNFLKNDILCIDIGFTNIKVIHSRKKAGNLIKVINFGISDTPRDCIRNGIINNLEGIAQNLKKIMDENHISEKNVKIVISAGSNIISKVIYVIHGDEKKMEERIKEEITRQIPVDVHAQKLFYRVTGEVERDKMMYHKVLITVVPNSTIENYIRLLKVLNFRPVSIEIPFSSVARFFGKGMKIMDRGIDYFKGTQIDTQHGSTAVIDLGSETTNLSVLNKGSLEFNRILLIGGRSLDEMIAKNLKVSREDAERFKKMHGIARVHQFEDEIEQGVHECVKFYLDEVLNNVMRSIEFYIERCGGAPLERVFFIGGGSAIKGLRAYAAEKLDKQVYTVDNIDFLNIEFESNLNKDKLRFLINALGLVV